MVSMCVSYCCWYGFWGFSSCWYVMCTCIFRVRVAGAEEARVLKVSEEVEVLLVYPDRKACSFGVYTAIRPPVRVSP